MRWVVSSASLWEFELLTTPKDTKYWLVNKARRSRARLTPGCGVIRLGNTTSYGLGIEGKSMWAPACASVIVHEQD